MLHTGPILTPTNLLARWICAFVLFGLLSLLAVPANGQDSTLRDTVETREVGLSADFLEGYEENGEAVRRLVGNVRLLQEATILTANEATEYPQRDDILFTGNVRIVDEGDTLWANRVLYNRGSKVGQAEGDVKLSDGDVLLDAPSGTYFVDEKRALLESGVRMVDSTAVLTSQRGQYWLDAKRAEFYDEVVLLEEQSRLEADSVTYFRETEIALGRGSVFIEHIGGEEESARPDSTSRTYLFGQSAYHDNRARYSRIEGDPLLVQLEQDTVEATIDTLLVRARILESSRSDSLNRLIAVEDVRIWQSAFAAIADSVVSDRFKIQGGDSTDSRDEIRFFGSPVAWNEDSQISGDTIVVKARSGSVDSLLVYSDAFVAQLDSALQKINQLRGRNMVGLFENDSLRTLVVDPNAEAIRFMRDDNDELTGAVQVSADQVLFLFSAGEIETIRAFGGIQGTQYEADQVSESLALDGLRWVPEQRPEKTQLMGTAEERLPAAQSPPVYTSIE